MKTTAAAPRPIAATASPLTYSTERIALRARLPGLAAILVGGLLCSTAIAADQSLEQGARDAGRATGSAFHDVGQGAKKVGLEIGHAAADAGKKVGHGAANAGRAIGRAAKEGAKSFWHAVKGDGQG
jgi:hypothetical protein